jgi:hypothetical protein
MTEHTPPDLPSQASLTKLNLLTGSMFSTYSVAEVNALLVFVVDRFAQSKPQPNEPRMIADRRAQADWETP